MASERVLLVGGTGFFGTALLERAARAGARCTVLSRRALPVEGHVAVDVVTEAQRLAAVLAEARPDVVFHLVGGPAPDPFAANVTPLRCVLAAVRAAGLAPRVVSVGSAAEYGDLGPQPIAEDAREQPVSEYGVAKLAQTRLALVARREGLAVTVARVFNVLGPGMPPSLAAARFARECIGAVARGASSITAGDLTTVRDYLDVADVADALWSIGAAERHEPIVNVCSGTAVSTGEVLAEILAQLGVELEVRSDPRFLRGAADVPVSVGRNDLLRALTGRAFGFSLAASVRRLLASVREPRP